MLIEKLPVVVRFVEAPSNAMSVSSIDTSPFASNAPVTVSVFPPSNSSDAFDRRKSADVSPSIVSEFEPAHVPSTNWKHPEVRAIPLAKVEVEFERDSMAPSSFVI